MHIELWCAEILIRTQLIIYSLDVNLDLWSYDVGSCSQKCMMIVYVKLVMLEIVYLWLSMFVYTWLMIYWHHCWVMLMYRRTIDICTRLQLPLTCDFHKDLHIPIISNCLAANCKHGEALHHLILVHEQHIVRKLTLCVSGIYFLVYCSGKFVFMCNLITILNNRILWFCFVSIV